MLNFNRIFSRGDKKPIYVLDTSAINSKEAMELIKEDCKVILTSVVIKEIDYQRKVNSSQIFLSRASKIVSESARDFNSKKYQVVEIKNEWKVEKKNVVNISRNDDAILEFCKTNRDYILLTADNVMANKAKEMKIKYWIFDVDEKIKSQNKSCNNMFCHLYGTKIQNNRLLLENSKSFNKSYLVLTQSLKMKFSLEKSYIVLNKGDQVCVATITSENVARFSFYEIINIVEDKNALFKNYINITHESEIDKIDVPEVIKKFMNQFVKRI